MIEPTTFQTETANEYPARRVDDPSGEVYYVPFIADDGRVGYRVGSTRTGEEGFSRYIYLNPSTGSDHGSPDVFVYEGTENDPSLDAPVVFVVARPQKES